MAEQQSIANDPHAYLQAYIALTPSRDALMQLSGPVAAYIQEQDDATVAAMFLSAGEYLLLFVGFSRLFRPTILLTLNHSHLLLLMFSRTPYGNGHAGGRVGSTAQPGRRGASR